MGIPLVGKEHQRKASTSQVADRKLRAVRIRISGASGSGCSSAKHQQSFQSQEPSADNSEHFVGTLLSGSASSKGDVHARRIQRLCKELDSPKMGQRTAGRAEDRRGGTLAARSGRDGWDQSQDQMCDVGFVFTRRSLGILRSQSYLVGDSGRKWGQERYKNWRARQCETSTGTPVLVARASETWSHKTRISGPVARASGWSVRDPSRRARRPTLVRLQLRQHELQRSPFILLAQRRASESNKDGGIGQTVADAFCLERCIAGGEMTKRLQRTWRFCIPLSSPQRQEATGSCV